MSTEMPTESLTRFAQRRERQYAEYKEPFRRWCAFCRGKKYGAYDGIEQSRVHCRHGMMRHAKIFRYAPVHAPTVSLLRCRAADMFPRPRLKVNDVATPRIRPSPEEKMLATRFARATPDTAGGCKMPRSLFDVGSEKREAKALHHIFFFFTPRVLTIRLAFKTDTLNRRRPLGPVMRLPPPAFRRVSQDEPPRPSSCLNALRRALPPPSATRESSACAIPTGTRL